MKNKKSIIIGITSLFLVTLILLGLTYAYYRTRIIGNPNDESISVTSKNLQLTYSDGTENINTTGIIEPGTVITKTFTVTNDGSESIEYGVYLEDVKNTFKRTQDVTYTLECTEGCTGIDTAREYPKENTILVSNTIEPTKTQSYKLVITYENLADVDQSDDMGATLSGRINIDLPNETSELILTLADAEVGDYATLNSEPKVSYGVYDAATKGVVFKFTGVESGNHTLTVYDKNKTEKGSTALVINNGETSGFTTGDTPTITVSDTNRVVSTTLSITSEKITLAEPVINKVVDKEELTGVTVNVLKAEAGENSVNGLTLYGTMEEAYNALQTYMGVKYKTYNTSSWQHYDVTKIPTEIIWTIYGNVTFDASNANHPYPEGHADASNLYALTGGLKSVWPEGATNNLGTNPIDSISLVGGNETATLTTTDQYVLQWAANSQYKKPYTIVKISNLTFNNSLIVRQYNSVDLSFTNCTIKSQLRIQSRGLVTFKNNHYKFEEAYSEENEGLYATMVMRATETPKVVFENNIVDGFPRGINMDVEDSEIIVKNNTFKNITHPTRAAIQLSKAKNTIVDNNTIDNVAGNAFWIYYYYAAPTTIITNNTITNTKYLAMLGDDSHALDASTLNITSSGNKVSVTTPGYGISKEGIVTANSFSLN